MLIHYPKSFHDPDFQQRLQGGCPEGFRWVNSKAKQKLCHHDKWLKKHRKRDQSGLWTGITSSLFQVVPASS
jgi:hypothetical protein